MRSTSVSSAHLQRVREAHEQLGQARRRRLLAILEARAAGATLQQVGDELGGISRQAVRGLEAAARKTLSNGGN
jgi:DNA-directed RNA polymerase sigma subunit (sigma70/sigma32)